MITNCYSVCAWEITGIAEGKKECHILVALMVDYVDDSVLNSIHDQAYEDSEDEAYSEALVVFEDRKVNTDYVAIEEYLPETPIEYRVEPGAAFREGALVVRMPDGRLVYAVRSAGIYDVDFYYYKAVANAR